MVPGQRNKIIVVVVTLFLVCSCRNDNTTTDYVFEKHIMFNHLNVVVDSTTYHLISKSNEFLMNFSGVVETQSDTEDESWSGKYLYGKGHYLEIFPPGGYPGARLGNVGIGFMPTKLYTLDSLYQYWKQTPDSVSRRARTIVENGVTYPWFTSLSFHDADSLQLRVFLQENAKEDMHYVGFTDEDLMKEISYWDYMRYYRAKVRGASPDSIQYEKLFDKVTGIHLALGEQELSLLTDHLRDFGFHQEGNVFKGNDIDITYDLVKDGFGLKQIGFLLTNSSPDTTYVLNTLTITVKGNEATFQFGWDQ